MGKKAPAAAVSSGSSIGSTSSPPAGEAGAVNSSPPAVEAEAGSGVTNCAPIESPAAATSGEEGAAADAGMPRGRRAE